MLILTRRIGETIMIGDEVTITVLGVKGNQVRIGINAPKEISVHREEIYQRIQREKEDENNIKIPPVITTISRNIAASSFNFSLFILLKFSFVNRIYLSLIINKLKRRRHIIHR